MPFTALVTVLAIALYFWTGLSVAKARRKFGVDVPATAGHADFERVFRVQQNMLEWMPIFLPLLWLFAFYVSDWGAALAGLVWVAGRLIYMRGYAEAAESRHMGFFIQLGACGVLFIGALVGIIMQFMRG